MRIVAGKFKGRRLVNFSADHIRPTTDRVKESIFNSIQMHVDGASVLDLFSGTGNLAIEALSRGAASVQIVEMNKKSLKIIDENLREFKIGEEAEIFRGDVFKFLKDYEGDGFDLIFIDPPFTEKLGHEVMLSISSSKVIHPGTRIIIETSSHERIDDNYEGLDFLNRRDFGDKLVSFYSREGARP